MAVTRSSQESVGYITVEVSAESTANRSLRGINPLASDADVVDVLHDVGELQSQNVTAYARQIQCHLVQ